MGALVILDNFEQLTSSANILAELLSACPRLKLLVTSRTVLNLRGEQELEIRPLPLPSPAGKTSRHPDLSSIESSPAIQLFVQRARSVKPAFTLDSENAQTIADICARLDGLPLAMELAAARIKLLSPKALLARLQKRLQVLTGGAQDLPARQQTLHNAINWSYDLLNPAERRIFRLLSVFSGGCTLEMAEAVCASMAERLPAGIGSEYAQGDVLELVTSLANKSLLRVIENDDDVRVVMLETLREYALDRLRESGEEDAALAALAQNILIFAEEAGTGLRGPEQARWLDNLEREIGNLRAVLEWCVSASGEDTDERLDAGLRIAGELTRFWEARSHLHEGSERLNALLERTVSMRTESRDRALRAAGRLAQYLGKDRNGDLYYQEALDIARERGDLIATTTALVGLGNCLIDSDEAAGMRAYQECLQIWLDLDYKPGIAGALNNIGIVLMSHRDPSAQEYFEKSVQLYREIGDKERLSLTMGSLGRVHIQKGDLLTGEKYARESFNLNLELGDPFDIAYNMIAFAEIACARNDYGRAVRLLATADATYDDFLERLDRFDTDSFTGTLERSRKALGDGAFNVAWSDGLRLTPVEAISTDSASVASAPASPVAPSSPSIPARVGVMPSAHVDNDPGLSTREAEVLALLAQGLTNAEIAERLILSQYTVHAHLRNIYGKLNVSSRAAAVRSALGGGLLST